MKKNCLVILFVFINIAVNAQVYNWQWARQGIANGEGFAVAKDNAGCAIITGQIVPPYGIFGNDTLTSSGHEVFVVKYDVLGNVLWARQGICGSPTGGSHGYAIATDAANNVYVSGYFFASTLSFDTITLVGTAYYDIFLVNF